MGGEVRLSKADHEALIEAIQNGDEREWVEKFTAARLAAAWIEGHTAGRDYQGDGWNSDAHDPASDNPYREDA